MASARVRARRREILRTNDSIRGRLGRRINWCKPPKPTRIVQWRHQGRSYKMSFRTACAMARLNNLSVMHFGKEITVIQPCFNTGVAASAGTHDYDCCFDLRIDGEDWLEVQAFFRRNGFAAWYRHEPLFSRHIHGFVLPPREGHSISDDFMVAGFKVGKYVDGGWSLYRRVVGSSQIEDYYGHRNALAGHAADNTWHPRDIERTIFDLDAFVARRVVDVARAKRVK